MDTAFSLQQEDTKVFTLPSCIHNCIEINKNQETEVVRTIKSIRDSDKR